MQTSTIGTRLRDETAEEVERQRLILLSEMPERLALNALAFGLATIFADPRIIGLLWGVNLAAEILGNWANARAGRSLYFYALTMAATLITEAAFVTAAGAVWHNPDPFAKAYAVGMITITLMHLATIRAIHLPAGIAGLVGVAGPGLLSNALYWLKADDMVGFTVSTLAAFGGLAYSLTAMLSNNRLHRSTAASEAAARAADEAKTIFLAQMSHELRTPLNAIIGMGEAELADDKARAADGPSNERLRIMVDSARSLATILDDVTDMNAISRGRLPLRPRVVRLADELRAFVARFEEQARGLGRRIEVITEGTCPGLIRIDSVRLQQCLGNLASNALRHSDDGTVRMICRTLTNVPGGPDRLAFDFIDSGPGVPEDLQATLFQPFRKGREATPGTGLGLAISRDLARRMGGDLVLLPSAKGAHFRLEVAFEHADDEAARTTEAPDLSGRRILVVDDIATNRLVAATYLRGMGASIVEAASGEEALALLGADPVDLVFLDVNMPLMDGFRTVAALRAMGGAMRDLPVIAMTADVLEEQVAEIRKSGFDGHLPKPILPELLAAELRRHL